MPQLEATTVAVVLLGTDVTGKLPDDDCNLPQVLDGWPAAERSLTNPMERRSKLREDIALGER